MYQISQKIIALLLLLMTLPLFLILYILVRMSSDGPFLYTQKRAGKDMKPFIIYKIRTMVRNAEQIKNKYLHLNQAEGPTFKIKNDPRFTKIGRYLARAGIDELPQLLNVVNGTMTFVGPRPLPLSEAEKIPQRYKKRFSIPPGITSPWVIQGSHNIPFKTWMELDSMYVKNHTIQGDMYIALQTVRLIIQT
ncbi:sugar transferase [Candidatus Roizmanbacteria bacterium]|nr:sugar transferase [Candidatus Roizmanbacteria bacterium]